MKKALSFIVVTALLISCMCQFVYAEEYSGPQKGPGELYVPTITEEDVTLDAQEEEFRRAYEAGEISLERYQAALEKIALTRSINNGTYIRPRISTDELENFPYIAQYTDECCGPACAYMTQQYKRPGYYSYNVIHNNFCVCQHSEDFDDNDSPISTPALQLTICVLL